MSELRMGLFLAEQRVLDAQLQADYYRSRIAFCEQVAKAGIELVSDRRKIPQEVAVDSSRPSLKLTAAQ
ncbi:hypothetical protein [Paraburkholderia hospita]|uniref:hypothetical protein n=1 Tax=Paraburkholderia hospita TaxID=169430 RepID=UPI001EE64351|nr:hypothetical protein [Paraburkholderia hospita]